MFLKKTYELLIHLDFLKIFFIEKIRKILDALQKIIAKNVKTHYVSHEGNYKSIKSFDHKNDCSLLNGTFIVTLILNYFNCFFLP